MSLMGSMDSYDTDGVTLSIYQKSLPVGFVIKVPCHVTENSNFIPIKSMGLLLFYLYHFELHILDFTVIKHFTLIVEDLEEANMS